MLVFVILCVLLSTHTKFKKKKYVHVTLCVSICYIHNFCRYNSLFDDKYIRYEIINMKYKITFIFRKISMAKLKFNLLVVLLGTVWYILPLKDHF